MRKDTEHPTASLPRQPAASSVVVALRRHARSKPDDECCTFHLPDGVELRRSYADLDRRAREIGALLRSLEITGPVLLVYPPSLDFVEAFFGCLYAGAVPVPAYPPDPGRASQALHRLEAIALDASADVVLTSSPLSDPLRACFADRPALERLRRVETDGAPAALEAHAFGDPDPRALAFLQYTSGSTGDPKGVMVSHANLAANVEAIRDAARILPGDRFGSWLPLYHDMGLIGCLLAPIFLGHPTSLMSAVDFLKRPASWLELITRKRVVISGGPNFAYDLCAERVSEEERSGLDLRSWRIAFNGSEPLRARSLARFQERFASCGLDAGALKPCYGLAEATLLASFTRSESSPVVRRYAEPALARGIAVASGPREPGRALVGSGSAAKGVRIRVVDPESRTPRAEREIGEIWLAGGSVARGYWNRADQSEAWFGARCDDPADTERYLRTGDLGFLDQGQLFVTGRSKELLIVHGRNHHPHDIEATAQAASPAARPGCGSAFAIDDGDAPSLVLVQEIRSAPALDLESVAKSMAAAVSRDHGIRLDAVALLPPRSIPKTSSGKLRRSVCRDLYRRGELPTSFHWQRPSVTTDAGDASAPAAPLRERDPEGLRRWLIAWLARELCLPTDAIDSDRPFDELGLDSARAVVLVGDLEGQLGARLSPTTPWEHPSVDALVRHLVGRFEPRAPTPRSVGPAGGDAVAVVGIGCRFPGAASPSAFWRMLADGVDAVREAPASRRGAGEAGAPGSYLERVDAFDPEFFGIAPHEAARMDPQQRLLLEVAWEALLDAGQPPESLRESPTGVFVGISGFDYGRGRLDPAEVDAHSVTGTAHSIAANRISYLLGLRGPSLSVDTACSSSLAALHLAVESIRRGESRAALAGGVNLLLSPEVSIGFAKAGLLSGDARCKAFGAGADGMVRAEGAGLVLLKPLADALRDRDRIYATVLATAMNNDGRSNGLTAPSLEAQVAVLEEAYARAGVPPERVDYVEAHGSGTALGDAIEAEALGRVVGRRRAPDAPCAIGSVKSNFGHAEAAAGIAGFIKAALAIFRRQLPASLHAESPNPQIPFPELGLAVQRKLVSLRPAGEGTVVGVSSFGFGGTNVHAVLAAGPEVEVSRRRPERSQLFAVSAHSPDALRALVRSYLDALDADPDLQPDALAYAAGRRGQYAERFALVARSRDDLRRGLAAFLDAPAPPDGLRGDARRRPRTVFVFSGHGSQWRGMGRRLQAEEPVFREALAACDGMIREHAGWSPLELLNGDAPAPDFDRVELCHPTLFSVQVSLAALLRSWGVEPDAVIGHSVGEVAAAAVAGALDLPDAARLVIERSRVLGSLAGQGGMAVVGLPAAEVQAALAGSDVVVAGINGPAATLLSGDDAALAEVVAGFQSRGVFTAPVRGLSVPAHSPRLDDLHPVLEDVLDGIGPRAGDVPFYSTVTGQRLAGSDLDAHYWARNLREPVLFGPAVESLLRHGHETFVELSPHPVVAGAVRECIAAHDAERAGRFVALGTLRREQPERESLLDTLGELYRRGHAPRWRALYPEAPRFAAGPPIPWMRRRCWVDGTRPGRRPAASQEPRPVASPGLGGRRAFEIDLEGDRYAFLDDHRVQGTPLLPATAYLEAVLSVAAQVGDAAAAQLEDVRFEKALFLRDRARTLHLVLDPIGAGSFGFEVFSRGADAEDHAGRWTRHARGRLRFAAEGESGRFDLAAARSRCPEQLAPELHYETVRRAGIEYGPAFRRLTQIGVGDGEAWGCVPVDAERGGFAFDPAVLDACLQVVASALTAGSDSGSLRLPVALDHFRLEAPPSGTVWSHARLHGTSGADATETRADVTLCDESGRRLAEIRGFRVRRLDERSVRQPERQWLHEIEWQPAGEGVAAEGGGGWLFLGGALARELVTKAQAEGERAVLLPVGPAALDLADAGAVRRSLLELAAAGDAACSEIVLLSDEAHAAAADEPSRAERGVVALVHLVHALADWPQAVARPRLFVVTRGAQATRTGEPACPAQAALWGLGRTIALEHPELWGGLLDLEPGDDRPLESIWNALRSGGEDQMALRSGQRLVPRLVRRSLGPAGEVRCRPDATYLVTGGLGALGLRVAEWLADRGACRLVLVGRSGLPARARWHDAGEPADGARSAAIGTVQELERRGVHVVVRECDVADRSAMRALFDELARTLPPLHGIVHAAGTADPLPLRQVDADSIRSALRAKVRGSHVLDELSRSLPLDFFVLFSSGAAVWGSRLLASYAAANHFLDGLAHRRAAEGLPALSVNWGRWQAGMADRATTGRTWDLLGLEPMDSRDALRALEVALHGDRAQVTIARVDWSRFRSVYEAHTTRHLLDAIDTGAGEGETGAKGELARRLRTGSRAERREILDRELTGTLARTLGVAPERVRGDASLESLGLDSLAAARIKVELEHALATEIPIVSFLRDNTIAELVSDLLAYHEAGPPEEGTDLASEARLDDAIRARARAAPAPRPRGVFLTGATGYLGSHLLAEILRSDDEALVYCLVRSADDREALARIRRASGAYANWNEAFAERIRPVPGDLCDERLGLDASGFDDLAGRVERIVHCGAWLNTVYPYRALRAANVGGTREVLRLSAHGDWIPVSLISSMAVFPWGPRAGRPELREVPTDDHTGFATGYSASKWVAEQLAHRAAERGAPVTFFRPGFVAGHGETGVANLDDLLCRLIRGCIQIGCFPDTGHLLDMTPVDYAARSIVALSRSPDTAGRIFHIVNPQPLAWTEFVEWIRARGYPVSLASYPRWLRQLRSACAGSEENALAHLLPVFDADPRDLFSAVRWDSRNTLAALEETDLRCPSVPDLLATYFDFFVRSGFLPEPGSREA